uniref:Uncharacterized protein n=1 Tax=Romanomermis culicivorax TaxID=13658 RepID=A0A915I2Z7_ROMCU
MLRRGKAILTGLNTQVDSIDNKSHLRHSLLCKYEMSLKSSYINRLLVFKFTSSSFTRRRRRKARKSKKEENSTKNVIFRRRVVDVLKLDREREDCRPIKKAIDQRKHIRIIFYALETGGKIDKGLLLAIILFNSSVVEHSLVEQKNTKHTTIIIFCKNVGCLITMISGVLM